MEVGLATLMSSKKVDMSLHMTQRCEHALVMDWLELQCRGTVSAMCPGATRVYECTADLRKSS